MYESEEGPADESTRHSKLNWMTNSLPCLSTVAPDGWVWTDEETAILRTACAARFDERLRTESLYCIAATAIRIYLMRIATTQSDNQV